MKKILNLLLITILLQGSLAAQDFAVTNPVMTPNPGVYPGGTETISFNFSVSQDYVFNSSAASNNYAYITFSFTKLNPTNSAPTGTGASLFNWTLTNNGGTGINLVYTWTGTTKSVAVSAVPTNYKITFSNVPITSPATTAESDVRVAGQFTDPGNAPTGLAGNNSAVIATYTGAGGPLPIHLLSFTGLKQTNSVQLNWQTSSEQNSNYFDVQFSEDGNTWKSLGKVKAAGLSNSQKDYTLTHYSPVNGANYYRLQEFDKDGNFYYSNTVIINFKINGLSINSVYPNPFTSQIKIDISTDRSQIVNMQVSDNEGRILKTQSYTLQSGVNKITLDNLDNLSQGVYFLEVKTPYAVLNYKLKK